MNYGQRVEQPLVNMLKISSIAKKIAPAVLVGLTLALLVSIGLLAWVPPVSRDALTHHLAVPKIYLQQGGIVELPHIPFSYYPMNLDLLYMVPLYFGNDILPKYVHFSFAVFTAGLICWYLRRRLSMPYALFGALFFLSLPIIVKLSITVYVDLGLIFFSTAALIFLLIWTESMSALRYLVLSAICCGLALGTKYNGLIVLVLSSLFIPFLYLRTERGKRFVQLKSIGHAALYVLVALAVYSPWMIRNTVWTGNPIYPLYNSFFQNTPSDDSELPIEIKKQINYHVGHWNHIAIRRAMFKESWGEIALIPVRIFFQGQDDQPQYFDGKLNPFLLMFSITAFVSIRRQSVSHRRELLILAAFVGLFMLIAFLGTSARVRYIAPVIPPLILLSVFGLHNLVNLFAERGRLFLCGSLLSVCVLCAFGINALYIYNQFRSVDPLSYISGKVSRDAYIAYRRPEYPVVNYANQFLSNNDAILCLFTGNRSYYSDKKLVFGENWFTQSVLTAASVEDIRADLFRSGYTHLFVNMDIVKQWTKTFDRLDQAKIAAFFNHHVRLLKQNHPFALYEIVFNSR